MGAPLAAAAFLLFTSGCEPVSGFTVGGKVAGTVGNFSLSLNGTETLEITKNGLYTFATRLQTAATYSVAVAAQPAGQTCTVANSSGVIGDANISNVNVTCTGNSQFHVSGGVTGLAGDLTIALSGAESLTLHGDGAYQFSTLLSNGDAYDVIVTAQPSGQQCSVANGAGAINLVDVTIAIHCVNTTPVVTHAWPGSVLGGYEVKLSGSNLDAASIAFNGAAIEPTLRTPHELRFIAPQNPRGTYALALENAAGASSYDVAQGEVVTVRWPFPMALRITVPCAVMARCCAGVPTVTARWATAARQEV